jgi:replicative DNA helicase
MGVDWNETAAGVQIVVVRYEPDKGKFRTSNVMEIPPSQFTQIEAVEKLIDLNELYQPKRIMLDAGYGNTQFQMLQKHAEEHPESRLDERLEMVPFQSKIQLVDPATGNKVSRSVKTHMVSVSARYVENNRVIMPASEDYPGKLVGIMRNYAIEKITSGGEPQYSKGKVHLLEAWILAMYGMWKISVDGEGLNMRNPSVVRVERDKKSKQSIRRNFKRSRGALDLSRGTLSGRRRWT